MQWPNSLFGAVWSSWIFKRTFGKSGWGAFRVFQKWNSTHSNKAEWSNQEKEYKIGSLENPDTKGWKWQADFNWQGQNNREKQKFQQVNTLLQMPNKDSFSPEAGIMLVYMNTFQKIPMQCNIGNWRIMKKKKRIRRGHTQYSLQNLGPCCWNIYR